LTASRHSRRLSSAALFLTLIVVLAGCSQLALFNAVVPRDAGVEVEARDVVYAGHERGKLDIYRPTNDADSPLPVLFFVYGGSWNSGSKDNYAFVGRAFAARGYVTVIADYRLVPQVRYPIFVEDAAAALAWTYRNIADHGGDPTRLFVAGHSAGAYNAAMLALQPRFLEGEGLERSIIDGFAGLSGPYDFLPLDMEASRAAFAGIADLEATQPVRLDPTGAPPAFLATGDEDDLVNPRNTRALAAHLRSAGRPVETRVYPGLDHAGTLLALSRPFRGTAPVVQDIDAFFRKLD
jgi:acetyl esterase/lipase